MRTAFKLLSIASVLLVSACDGQVQPLDSEKQPLTSLADPNTEVAGYSQIILRTYVETDDGLQEVAGATCSFNSRQVSGTAISPRRVQIPKFTQTADLPDRGRPDNVMVSCSLDGRSGSTTVYPLRHPSELEAARAGASGQAPRSTATGGVGAEIGTFIGNAVVSQIFSSAAWTYLYSPATVALR